MLLRCAAATVALGLALLVVGCGGGAKGTITSAVSGEVRAAGGDQGLTPLIDHATGTCGHARCPPAP